MVYVFRIINEVYEDRDRKMAGQELKRIYRCPNCDAVILTKPEYNALHNCSCGAFTHIKNWKIEFEVA